jgi:hypothetical protein
MRSDGWHLHCHAVDTSDGAGGATQWAGGRLMLLGAISMSIASQTCRARSGASAAAN